MLRNGTCSDEESPMSITCNSTASSLLSQRGSELGHPRDTEYFARMKRDYFAKFADEMGNQTVRFRNDDGGAWISVPEDAKAVEPRLDWVRKRLRLRPPTSQLLEEPLATIYSRYL